MEVWSSIIQYSETSREGFSSNEGEQQLLFFETELSK